MIVPTGWYSGARFGKLRRFFACTTDVEVFVNLPYDIFSAWVDTTIFVANKRVDFIGRELWNSDQINNIPKAISIKSSRGL